MSALELSMNRSEAEMVTASIRTTVAGLVRGHEKLGQLIEQARAGNAHAALGYQSWTAYVAAEFAGAAAGLTRPDRQRVVAELASTGLPVRAVATVVEVGKSTVDRDLKQVSHGGTPAVGVDGKVYARNGRATSNGVDAISDAVPAVKARPVRPAPPRELQLVNNIRQYLRDMSYSKDVGSLSRAELKYVVQALREAAERVEGLMIDAP